MIQSRKENSMKAMSMPRTSFQAINNIKRATMKALSNAIMIVTTA
jgi:hypothetical protein